MTIISNFDISNVEVKLNEDFHFVMRFKEIEKPLYELFSLNGFSFTLELRIDEYHKVPFKIFEDIEYEVDSEKSCVSLKINLEESDFDGRDNLFYIIYFGNKINKNPILLGKITKRL